MFIVLILFYELLLQGYYKTHIMITHLTRQQEQSEYERTDQPGYFGDSTVILKSV